MTSEKDAPDSAFLPTIANILLRLQRTTEERGNHMLAYLIDLARAEAEEQLRLNVEDAQFRADVLATSSRHSWRLGARAPEAEAALVDAIERLGGEAGEAGSRETSQAEAA